MRPQDRSLFGGKLKHEIFRKSASVSLDCLVQTLGSNSVERGEVAIKDYTLTAQIEDCVRNVSDGSVRQFASFHSSNMSTVRTDRYATIARNFAEMLVPKMFAEARGNAS